MPNPSRRSLAIVGLLIILINAAYGQDGKTVARNISISLGAVHYRFIDEAFAHSRVQYSVQGGGGSGWMSAYAQWPDARVLRLWLNAAYARRILDHTLMQAPSTLYIGAQLASSNWVIENVDEYDEGTINGFNTVNIFIFHKTMISTGSRIEVSLSLPVVGLVKRSSYDGGINLELEQEYDEGELHVIFDHAKLSGVNPLRLPELTIDFVRSIEPNTDFIMSYRFNCLKNPTTPPINLYSNTLTAGLRFNFDRNK